jgi:hypothetical protein
MTSKFNLYDQLGYVLVWFYLLLGSYFLLHINWIQLFQLSLNFWESVLVVFTAYFLGHIAQGISKIFVNMHQTITKCAWSKLETNKFQPIRNDVKNKFNLPANTDNETLFQYAYLYVLRNDRWGQVAHFISLHSFYRWLWSATILLLFTFLVYVVIHRFILHIWKCWWLDVIIFCILIGLIFLWNYRRNKFYEHCWEKVWINFDILQKINIEEKILPVSSNPTIKK